VTSQRLSSGELIFIARDVPPFAARSYHVTKGPAEEHGDVHAEDNKLVHRSFTLGIDKNTGAISSLFSRSLNRELVDPKAATALNDYFYLRELISKGCSGMRKPAIRVRKKVLCWRR
jgi:hypothetical protein